MYLDGMWFRNLTLVMTVFCLMLFNIFALSGILYDAADMIGYSVGLFFFGTAYSLAVLFLSLQHDLLPRGRLILRWMFICALIPTLIFSYALWVMAFC